MGRKKTHEEYVTELAIKNPNVEAMEEYKGANTKIQHHCKTHNVYWDITPHNALEGKGCKMCGAEKQYEKTRKSHDVYCEELRMKNPTVEAVEQYININTPILHHCLIHNVIWETTPGRALQGCGCAQCKRERFHEVRCLSHDEYVEVVRQVNPNIIVVGQYIDARTPIEHYCVLHDIFWSALPTNILKGHGCKECGNEKSRNKKIKPHEQYVKELKNVNPNIEVTEQYKGANTPILHRCKVDNNVWHASPANILSGKGCPICSESHGERQIRQWLEKYNIKYIVQQTFEDCKNQRLLPFDFYLPRYNTCIEYDGEQHFRPIEFFGGKDGFAKRQHNDTIKTQYCKDNNIHLLRIPYFKNVEEELESFIHLV